MQKLDVVPKVCESFNDHLLLDSLPKPCQSTRLHDALCEQVYSYGLLIACHVRCKTQVEESVFTYDCVYSRLNLGLLGPKSIDLHMPPQSQNHCLLDMKEIQYSGNCNMNETEGRDQFLALMVLQYLQSFTQITITEVLSDTSRVALSNQISFSVSSVKWK